MHVYIIKAVCDWPIMNKVKPCMQAYIVVILEEPTLKYVYKRSTIFYQKVKNVGCFWQQIA